MAEVSVPESKQKIQARLISIVRIADLDIEPLNADRLQNLWARLNTEVVKESPAEIQENYALRSATGTAWFDATADSNRLYRYKIQVVTQRAVSDDLLTNSIKYPAAKFTTDIRASLINPINDGIYAEFKVLDNGKMVRCKILRSYYLRSGYEAIAVKPLFQNRNGILIISFTDKKAVSKVPYTYVVVPYDAAGNRN